jgi:hypothetical protein
LICTLPQSRREDKGFWTEWQENFNSTMANCKNRHKHNTNYIKKQTRNTTQTTKYFIADPALN